MQNSAFNLNSAPVLPQELISRKRPHEENDSEIRCVLGESLRSVSETEPLTHIGSASYSLPEAEPAPKRSRRVAITKPGLEERGGCCFVLTDLDKCTDFIPPPTPEIRETIDHYQKHNLEVKTGAVHNRGVFLRGGAEPVKKGQVVAIYRGIPINIRELTKVELRLCGYPKDEPLKKLVWTDAEGTPTLLQRPASYQAHSPYIYYRDQQKQKVLIGIDAIDSSDAISHINSQQECDNIEFLVHRENPRPMDVVMNGWLRLP